MTKHINVYRYFADINVMVKTIIYTMYKQMLYPPLFCDTPAVKNRVDGRW